MEGTLEATIISADELKGMSLNQLASVIKKDWSKQGKGVNFAAKPYLDAMFSLNTVNDNYGLDSGKSIVLYFLSNASTYRGDQAKLVKAELKRRCGIK